VAPALIDLNRRGLTVSESDSTADLVARLRAGDPDAAEQLFTQYAQRLTWLAEQHLSRRLAGRLDGEDVVQSVFRTFFRRNARDEFQINSANQMWRLLVQITLRKARAKARHHTAGQRDARAEAGGGDAWVADVLSREPGPDEAAVLIDLLETLLQELRPQHGQVLELRLQGHSAAEIAEQLGVTRQTVYRILGEFQERLNRVEATEG
jgi:RNA polymerase sigma-70 factor (ECF subfamily)